MFKRKKILRRILHTKKQKMVGVTSQKSMMENGSYQNINVDRSIFNTTHLCVAVEGPKFLWMTSVTLHFEVG